MGKKDKDKSKKSGKKNKNMAENDIIETEGSVVETKSAKTLNEQSSSGMRNVHRQALGMLDKLGISRRDDVPQELIRLLDDVRDLDEPKVVAIADTIRHMSTFNALVRDNVENINVGNRYLAITRDVRLGARRLEDAHQSIAGWSHQLYREDVEPLDADASRHSIRPLR